MPEQQMAVWRSRSSGVSWERLSVGLPANAWITVLRENLAVDRCDPACVYVGTSTGQLFYSRAMSWLACIRCGQHDQPERDQERREGRAVKDDMHRIGHDSIALRQKRMGLAKHRTVARYPIRWRAKKAGDPPRLEFAREEYAINVRARAYLCSSSCRNRRLAHPD